MRWFILILALGAPVQAETLVAARTIRAQSILTAEDLAFIETSVAGMMSNPAEVIGMEARTILYEGRPIRPSDIGPAAIVERNAIVTLVFKSGALTITAEGRSMGRAGPGDQLRVTNLASRTTVTGIVAPDGRVHVGSLSGF